jgi:hypothetical protein
MLIFFPAASGCNPYPTSKMMDHPFSINPQVSSVYGGRPQPLTAYRGDKRATLNQLRDRDLWVLGLHKGRDISRLSERLCSQERLYRTELVTVCCNELHVLPFVCCTVSRTLDSCSHKKSSNDELFYVSAPTVFWENYRTEHFPKPLPTHAIDFQS